jgi:epoxide hydrolase 4
MINYYRALFRRTPKQTEAALRPVTAPTRIIWGERDRYLGKESAEPDRADVPNLEQVIRCRMHRTGFSTTSPTR